MFHARCTRGFLHSDPCIFNRADATLSRHTIVWNTSEFYCTRPHVSIYCLSCSLSYPPRCRKRVTRCYVHFSTLVSHLVGEESWVTGLVYQIFSCRDIHGKSSQTQSLSPSIHFFSHTHKYLSAFCLAIYFKLKILKLKQQSLQNTSVWCERKRCDFPPQIKAWMGLYGLKKVIFKLIK